MAGGNFLSELKRRNVYRVGAAYAVAAFVLIEVVSNLAPMLDLPGWIGRAVILLLIVGFPAILCLAWVYEITPGGVKRTAEVEQDASVTHQTGHRLNIVIIGLIVVLAGLYGADRFLLTDESAEPRAASATAAPGDLSIVVLPFLNLSSDPEQEFFSDGMTEEITSALAKVPKMRVVGRTSAFKFKGQNDDLRTISRALSATHVLEGSVRKEGNQIRVTAQLIRADDGTHIWTDNYDRELKSVFAIQDEIATAIAGALQVPLGLKTGETLVPSRNISPENYQHYLHAKAIYRARVKEKDNLDATAIGEQVVKLEPSYAPAWAMLAEAYVGAPAYGHELETADEYRRRVDASLTKAEAAGRRAIALEPQNAGSYAGLAAVLHRRGKYVEAEDLFKQALKIEAFNPDLLHHYRLSLLFNGRTREAVTVSQQLRALEPLVPRFNMWLSTALVTAGQYEAALAIANALPIEDGNRLGLLIGANIFLGRRGDAADVILGNPARFQPDVAATAIQVLRMLPTAVGPPKLPDLGELNLIYCCVGDPEPYFQMRFGRAERDLDAGYYFPSHLWQPAFAPARKSERFKTLMRKFGLVDYWRARGWPDVCRPVGADDFECD